MNVFFEEHLEILALLIKNEVNFLLIGGYAVISHGYNRTTGDMDLWLEPSNENKNRFLNSFIEYGFEEIELIEIKKMDFEKHQVFSFGEVPYKVDFLTKISQVEFKDAFENKITVEHESLILPIINLRELILSKINTGRKKDEADIEELQKLQIEK